MRQTSDTEGLSHLVLLRLSGDIGTKARPTRSRFVARLLHNLRDALAAERIRAHVERTRGRIFVHADRPQALAVLQRVFGLQSLALVERHAASDLAALVETGRALFAERVRGRRFAVRARRVGDRDRIALGAREVEVALGTALLPDSAGVDLDHPEVTARVELCEGAAHFFSESEPGFGGLPLGVEGRAVALVSGGFDSAVAAWLMMKRGVALDYVFCNLGGATHELGVLRVQKVLADQWSYGDRPRLHAVDFQALAEELRRRTAPRYWQVLLKRLMLRAAEAVARERRCLAIVTGEAVGQVSSQTLANLSVISGATSLAILRPLAGLNKDEILALARRIGTYELSSVVGEYCAMVPRRPATEAAADAIAEEEARLDLGSLARAVATREVFDLRTLSLDAMGMPELEIGSVPEGAVVIDLRSREAYDAWHWPGALQLDFARALAAYPAIGSRGPFVLYCEFGLKSAHLAERMRKAGHEAWHFRGGLRSVMRHAEERGLGSPALLGPVRLAD